MPATASRPLRLVLDTNVVVAGLLWDGSPRRLTDLAIMAQTVELYSSVVLLDELARTLGYAKFDKPVESFGTTIAAPVAQYAALVSLGPRAQSSQSNSIVSRGACDRPRGLCRRAVFLELTAVGERSAVPLLRDSQQ